MWGMPKLVGVNLVQKCSGQIPTRGDAVDVNSGLLGGLLGCSAEDV
jgi:hypothetical protein